MTYYGSKLSPNITRTREGYLIAMNVPIARTGVQKYLPREVPIEDVEKYVGSDGMVTVYREPDDVFSSATIASFEGKPVTDNHPGTASADGLVDTSNEAYLSKGHAQNVHRGTGKDADKLLADLYITDPMLATSVEHKNKRDVSCGYTSDYIPEKGKVYQRNLRGNHIAVVPRGRAGSGVAIQDSMPPMAGRSTDMLDAIKNKIFGLGLKEFVQDAQPEELSALMGGATAPAAPAPAAAPAQDAPPAPAAPAGGSTDKLDRLIGLIEKLLEADHATAPAAPKAPTPMEALDAAIGEEKGEGKGGEEGEISEALEEEQEEEEPKATSDAAILDHVKRMKPIIAGLPAGATRDAAATELLTLLNGGVKPKDHVYAGIAKVAKAAKPAKVKDSAPEQPVTIQDKAQIFADNCAKMREGGK